MKFWKRITFAVVFCFLAPGSFLLKCADAWEWSDLVGGGAVAANGAPSITTLSIQEVSDLRARDIKRRLARTHGYSAEELAKMIDKKELIQALAFEEEKVRLKQEDEAKRMVVKQGIIATLITLLIAFFWPLIVQAYEVAFVNFVVFTDRKKYEASRCWELRSYWGMLGVIVMGILDLMKVWLTASVLLSWVTTSKYFFPTPSFSIRPAQLMGGEVAKSSLANYGLNIGPMIIRWLMSFVSVKIEKWTGQAMAASHRAQKKAAREWESTEEKAARKAARKQRKLEKKLQEEQAAAEAALRQQLHEQQAAAASATSSGDPSPLPDDWKPNGQQQENQHPVQETDAHKEFLEQLEKHQYELDDLD